MAGRDADVADPARRRWLRGLLPRGAEAVGRAVGCAVDARLPKRRRPPGAVPEALFLAGCTQCMQCVEACPHNAIHTLKDSVGLGAGTPVMVPEARACHMCDGFPCAAACPEKVLEVPSAPVWRLGTARIDPQRCLPFRGPECGACAGWCPEGAPALTLRLGKPRIDPAICVGCGLCIPACPTRPGAIDIAPLDGGPA